MDAKPRHVAADLDQFRSVAAEFEQEQKYVLAAIVRQVADEFEQARAAAPCRGERSLEPSAL